MRHQGSKKFHTEIVIFFSSGGFETKIKPPPKNPQLNFQSSQRLDFLTLGHFLMIQQYLSHHASNFDLTFDKRLRSKKQNRFHHCSAKGLN